MNKHLSTGRLVADPELKTTQNGISVCTFRLAVSRPRVKDTTDFLNYVVWRQSAEYLCKYGKRGDLVEVTGTLTSRNYEDSNGNKRTIYETQVDELKLLSNKGSDSPNKEYTQDTNSSNMGEIIGDATFEEVLPSDELPF